MPDDLCVGLGAPLGSVPIAFLWHCLLVAPITHIQSSHVLCASTSPCQGSVMCAHTQATFYSCPGFCRCGLSFWVRVKPQSWECGKFFVESSPFDMIGEGQAAAIPPFPLKIFKFLFQAAVVPAQSTHIKYCLCLLKRRLPNCLAVFGWELLSLFPASEFLHQNHRFHWVLALLCVGCGVQDWCTFSQINQVGVEQDQGSIPGVEIEKCKAQGSQG